MKRLYVKGLVRLADQIRRELAAGVDHRQAGALQDRIRRAVDAVREQVAAHGLKIAHLPPPSRKAFAYLDTVRVMPTPTTTAPTNTASTDSASTDSASTDSASTDSASTDSASIDSASTNTDSPLASHSNAPRPISKPHRTVRITGLASLLDALLDRLARTQDDETLRATAETMDRSCRRADTNLQTRGLQPADLTDNSRDTLNWMRYFRHAENLQAYVDAVHRATRAIEPALRGTRYAPPALCQFRPMKYIYRLRNTGDGTSLHMPSAMVSFDTGDFAVLRDFIFDTRPHARRAVLERMADTPYQDLAARLDPRETDADRAAGAVHDLDDAFQRVNQAYFDGTMPRPRLRWNRQATSCKFGHYDHLNDELMLSVSLDTPDVPPFVVDFVMYHELLHKKLGTAWNRSRRSVHPPEFRREERKFARYPEAEAWLTRLARKYAGRP